MTLVWSAMFERGPILELLQLEYGTSLPGQHRTGDRYPVFGSNGQIGTHSEYLVGGPGIIIGRKGSVGEVCWSARPFWPIDTTYFCLPKGDTDLRWLFWLLKNANLKRLDATTGVPGLNRNDVYLLSVPQPQPVEQSRIAAVLDWTDDAIAKTEAVIAKLKQVHAGLLHDLLTRGLDERGQRRDPVVRPEQFKGSPLGLIPNDWSVRLIEECCSDVVDCPHSTPNFREAGVLVARTMNIKDGRFDERSASRVSEAEYLERVTRLRPQPGDVIFTREAPVGEAFVVPNGMQICLGQRVMLLRPRLDEIIGPYLTAQIYSGAVRCRINALTGGTTNPHLNVGEVRKLPIPIPRPPEQKRIVAAIGASEEIIAAEELVLSKRRNLKFGLMADLLNGRVRVPESILSMEAHE